MVLNILTARRSRGHLHITDVLAYGYLLLGILLMFGPALWLAASSFKTKAALQEFPPSALPLGQKEIHIPGRSEGLPAFRVTLPDGSTPDELGLLRRIGLQGQFVDPKAPDGEVIRAPMTDARAVREMRFAWENYVEPLRRFRFDRFLANSVFVTVVSTAITLLINSMCAFALSKYTFRGRNAIFGDPGACVPCRDRARAHQFAVGRDPAAGRDANRRVPAAPVHADDSRRVDRRGAHGRCQRMAGVLAHRAAADRSGARRAGHLLRDVAVE
jgi:hypothetical protein